MSMKNMVTKLALAYVATKGVREFQRAGGMDGIRKRMSQNDGGGAAGGGLGGLLGGGTAGEMQQGKGKSGIDSLLGGLAGMRSGKPAGDQQLEGLLARTRKEDARAENEEAESELILRAMLLAARADGEIDKGEREAIEAELGDSDEDRQALKNLLSQDDSVDSLASDTPEGLETEIYTASVMAIEPDNRAEAEHLDKLAKKLNIDQSTVNSIHRSLNKTPLY